MSVIVLICTYLFEFTYNLKRVAPLNFGCSISSVHTKPSWDEDVLGFTEPRVLIFQVICWYIWNCSLVCFIVVCNVGLHWCDIFVEVYVCFCRQCAAVHQHIGDWSYCFWINKSPLVQKIKESAADLPKKSVVHSYAYNAEPTIHHIWLFT